MGANDRQEAGDHYQASVQHWDVVSHNGIGYLEGNATKYLTRWRKKNGLQDLRKARHYVEKISELIPEISYKASGTVPREQLIAFLAANRIRTVIEEEAIWILLSEFDAIDIHTVLGIIDALIAEVSGT